MTNKKKSQLERSGQSELVLIHSVASEMIGVVKRKSDNKNFHEVAKYLAKDFKEYFLDNLNAETLVEAIKAADGNITLIATNTMVEQLKSLKEVTSTDTHSEIDEYIEAISKEAA